MHNTIIVKVYRFNPSKESKGCFDTHEVPIDSGMSVGNVLTYIYENLDSTLAYYSGCRRGACKGCWVSVNGKHVLACSELVKGDLTIEPLPKYKVIKDLYVDLSKRVSE